MRLFLDANVLTGDLKDFGPFMNQPEKPFGIVIQTIADFLAHLGSRNL